MIDSGTRDTQFLVVTTLGTALSAELVRHYHSAHKRPAPISTNSTSAAPMATVPVAYTQTEPDPPTAPATIREPNEKNMTIKSADQWGPFAPDLDQAEQRARLRALRAISRIIAGPRAVEPLDLLAQLSTIPLRWRRPPTRSMPSLP